MRAGRLPPARPVPLPAAPVPGPFRWDGMISGSVGYVVGSDGHRLLGVNLAPGAEAMPQWRLLKRQEWLLDALNRAWNLEQHQKANERAYGPGGTAP